MVAHDLDEVVPLLAVLTAEATTFVHHGGELSLVENLATSVLIRGTKLRARRALQKRDVVRVRRRVVAATGVAVPVGVLVLRLVVRRRVALPGKRGPLHLSPLRRVELVHDELGNLPLVVGISGDEEDTGVILLVRNEHLLVAPVHDVGEHRRFRRPDDGGPVLAVAVVQRSLGVAQEVQRAVLLVHPDQSPGTIDQLQRRRRTDLVDGGEDRLAVGAVLLVVLETLVSVRVEGAVVHPHHMLELERVGVGRRLLADSGVTIVPKSGADGVGRADRLVILGQVEQIERIARGLDDLERLLVTADEARPGGVGAANTVDQQQLCEKVFPVAGTIPGDAN